ncbi:MAG: VWA domain-containing protein [Actinomycetota bacterium]|nr:VWA domain-containing protein [Actinomycetota bacterium]
MRLRGRRRRRRESRRFTYSSWDGTQSVVDLDADALLQAMGDELIEHGDPNAALRRILHGGLEVDGERLQGLREMLERLRQQRQEMLEQHDLGGVYDEIRDALGEVMETERGSLDGLEEVGDDVVAESTRRRREQLDLIGHENLAGQVSGLTDYDFTSTEAAERFEELLEELRRQLMQQAVDQMAGAMQDLSPEDLARMKDMLAELNQMLEQRRAGEVPDFEGFMERYGDFFPENPQTLDELLEVMARRMAAMQQMLNSMTPEQRAQLQELSEQLLGDMDLQWQMDQLGDHLRELFPQMGWEQSRNFTGQDPLDMGEAMDIFDELADLDQLEQMLRGASSPGALAEVDIDRVRDLLGDESAESLERLSELARMLEEAGLVDNHEGQLSLTPRAIRRLGQNALGDLYRRLLRDRAGRHDLERSGVGHEREYTTKTYEFGDPFNLHIERTLRNAVTRGGVGTPVKLTPDDFEVERTESTVQAATVLMLDLSLSMPMRDNFLPAKKVSMALHSLISTQFPHDYLGVVTFSEVAREIKPERIPEVSWDYVYGTNMQHGLVLARQMLARQTGTRQIIMVTDGEPTAHITDQGYPQFNYPPSQETVDRTLTEVRRCTRDGIRINVFMLDATPYLTRFIETVTKMNGGRAFFTTNQNLGDYVLVDFVDQRRTLRTSR